MKTAFFAALLIAATFPIHAAFMNGNDLLEDLNGSVSEKRYATGYIVGVVDGVVHAKKLGWKGGWCFSLPAVTSQQVADVVRLWLEKNPASRHYLAAGQVSSALAESYPCKP